MHVQSQMTSSMFQNEQLNVMKRHDEILEKQEKEDFKKGMEFEKRHEILTRGHPVILHTGVANVQDRSEFSKNVISPTKFKLEKVIRILSIAWRFIKSFRSRKLKAL